MPFTTTSIDMPVPTKDIDKIVKLLQKENSKVVFFVGAGISTNCGIPDFRSPETGLYANLRKLSLPYPEAVFDIEYFKNKPKAFYTLADELFPGKFAPSKFHYLIRLCQDKNLLKRCYSQNIDTLERIAGVEDDKIVEAHGSFASNHCIECNTEMSKEKLREFMNRGEIPSCLECQGYVKPDIVFFGEALPTKLWDLWEEDIDDMDIAIVAGTSLAVYPFANLPAEVTKKATRVLINRELCGDFELSPRKTDIVLLEDCDSIAETICERLNWSKELEQLVAKGKSQIGGTRYKGDETADELGELISEKVSKAILKEEGQEGDRKDGEKEEDICALVDAMENVKVD